MEIINAINKSFTGILESKLMCESGSSLGLSVLFVEFREFDKVKGSLSTIEFPNRIVVSLASNVYAYQMVGALYRKVSETCVVYAMRIVSREPLGGEYVVLHQYFFSSNGVVGPEPLKASYHNQAD